jgi:hypothetical protein
MGKIKFGRKVYFIYKAAVDDSALNIDDWCNYEYFGRTTCEESAKRICDGGEVITDEERRWRAPSLIYKKEFV